MQNYYLNFKRVNNYKRRGNSPQKKEQLCYLDVLCNGGGVTVSYFELLKNLKHIRWGRLLRKVSLYRLSDNKYQRKKLLKLFNRDTTRNFRLSCKITALRSEVEGHSLCSFIVADVYCYKSRFGYDLARKIQTEEQQSMYQLQPNSKIFFRLLVIDIQKMINNPLYVQYTLMVLPF